MAEILKEWLNERLQKPITWEAEAFGNMMKNGLVIAGVLLSYHVINEEEYFLIRSGNVFEDVNNNWKYIKEWLHSLDIELNKNELEPIMDGKSSSLLRLFYQLFLHLDKRDRTDFVRQERKKVSGLVEKLGHRFKIDKVAEEKELFVDNLSKPLLNEKHFIEWQRKKIKEVKETYDYVQHKYSKMVKIIEEKNTPLKIIRNRPYKLKDKDQKEMEKFASKYPCKIEDYTYEKLLCLEKKSAEQRSAISNSDWTKNYLDNLHIKMHKKADSQEFQRQLRNTISTSLWDRSIAKEENRVDSIMAKRVMKLSQFEKQMCTQIMEIKQQARNLNKNRVQAESEFNDQRIYQLNEFLINIKQLIRSVISENDFEYQRQEILHKTLYAEKMKRKRQHYYEICYEIALSLVDYATKYGYFKKMMGDDIPDHYVHEWKALFYKEQSLFDILDPMEDILKESNEEEEQDPEEEEIVKLELDRQEALNDEEFQEYNNYLDPWNLDLLIPNFDSESEDRKYEYLGLRVLGHVVYTLLQIKYPYPPQLPPADLPDYSAKSILRGLPDRAITVPMQILLNARKIHVVRPEVAINFCLHKFKSELGKCVDIELSFDKLSAEARDEDIKEISNDSKYKLNENTVHVPPNVKQIQTPKTIPEEELNLSNAAELGKHAYETLYSGDTLTDHLLSSIIVEYIKDQSDINGFVIVNYPNSYREAQILEETFLGIAPPDDPDQSDRDDIYLEESIKKHRKREKDTYKHLRISKIVSDPHKIKVLKPFESYFTSYINLKHSKDILQEQFIWNFNLENSQLIDRFYALLGIHYSMYYEVIDKILLSQICYYIIGDILLPLTSYATLFGEDVLKQLDFPSALDKRVKSKIIKPTGNVEQSDEHIGYNSKLSKLTFHELQVVKEASLEKYREESVIPHDEASEENQILAGEEDWDYGELPIPPIIGVALANCWEEIEKVYMRDLTQLFFAKRLELNCLIPYARYIKDKMEQIITLPSNKQDLVCRFQQEYNDFEIDWRDIHLTKNEWHCRVLELQQKLNHICDERRAHAMRQRQLLIMDNWAMDELTNMANTYISLMQTELNRSIMTFQALHDFYFTLLKGMPPVERLYSKDLVKIFREIEETSGKKSSEDKVYKQIKAAYQDLQLRDIEIDYLNNPFNSIIDNNAKLAIKIVKDTNDSYRSVLAREYGEIAKIQPSTKKKDDTTSEESVNAEAVFKEMGLRCIEEWTMGINGEMYRASLRMLALQYKCYNDMKLFNDHVYKTFMEILRDINNYYMNEIKSVDRLCKYVQMAIENGRRIPETLILEQDRFVIDPNLLQYSPSVNSMEVNLVEETRSAVDFRISQLAALRSLCTIVAPTGIILQDAFIYLLQDVILFGKETSEGALFPKLWDCIDPEKVFQLVYILFGKTVYVDWRDFLIYCLNLRFPTVDELLEATNNLKSHDPELTDLINKYAFLDTELWYESDFDVDCKNTILRKNLIKRFLFDLFQTEEDKMNYNTFLLAFCKSTNPCEAFAMALSMSVGKKTCFSLDECEEIVCKFIKDKQYRDACMACALKCTAHFLDTLLNRVVNYAEHYTVSEVDPFIEDRNRKKLRVPSKIIQGNKFGRSQSVHLSKHNMVTDTKKTQSTTTVKYTYICKPCEDEMEEKEETIEKVEEAEEEQSIELFIDPNVVYAVEQSVIWKILRACLPWHYVLFPEDRKTPYVDEMIDLLKLLEADTDNGDIYVCKLLSHPSISEILSEVMKFTALNITDEILKAFT